MPMNGRTEPIAKLALVGKSEDFAADFHPSSDAIPNWVDEEEV